MHWRANETPNTYAAGWPYYLCKVTSVKPKPEGNVVLYVIPGTGETGFTDEARVSISENDPGNKAMLATILTAVSAGSEISIGLASPPTWSVQDVLGLTWDPK